ncbi:MAG: OsmC family protein [Proteobacteria bacterium]|nr:OsmC family protein [Pseudomonadota bacterium]
MKVRVRWTDHMRFEAETGSGHSVVMDGPPDHGGQNLAARPMEMILVGMGGCSAFDVVHMLKKARQPVENCEVELHAERADAVPAVFTKIHLHFIVAGPDLDHRRVDRAIALSVEKYCSVIVMLRDSVDITYDYEILAQNAGA